jgi:tRNA(Arg) A34 adenosine deaminase TadA
MIVHELSLSLPRWLEDELHELPPCLTTRSEQMQLALRLARRNIEHDTGGPFAALVVEARSGRLVACGVNRVVPEHCSSAHAEIMALSLAQRALGTYDLGAGSARHELVVNWRPCAMCFGAVLWSGVRALVIGGSGPELEELTGFDEGPLVANWREELERRGISVQDSVEHEGAVELFRDFRQLGRRVYNGRSG